MNERKHRRTKINCSIGAFEKGTKASGTHSSSTSGLQRSLHVKASKQPWKTNRRCYEFLKSLLILVSVIPGRVDYKRRVSEAQVVDIYWPLYQETTARTNHLSPYRAENGKALYTVFTWAWRKLPCGTRRWRAKGRRDYVIRLGDLIEGWDLCSARAEHWCYRRRSGECR